jgi:hypothetical protein
VIPADPNLQIPAPAEWIEHVSELRLPVRASERLVDLMDRNNDGMLNESERAELESLVELTQTLSLVRAQAYQLLNRRPA